MSESSERMPSAGFFRQSSSTSTTTSTSTSTPFSSTPFSAAPSGQNPFANYLNKSALPKSIANTASAKASAEAEREKAAKAISQSLKNPFKPYIPPSLPEQRSTSQSSTSSDSGAKFAFGTLQAEVEEMHAAKERERKEELDRKMMAVAQASERFAPLPSQTAESQALHDLVVGAMAKRDKWAGHSRQPQESNKGKTKMRATQAALDRLDKEEARQNGGNYRRALQASKRKARKNLTY